ncbi:hypothetical protein [Thermovibrio ammonificans]|uniref:Uncharacterized protein n=1 Tax=Thermovibrio ammonificans (strain DSM 15698 / JCM 12110 / HB-1) TaxID=648996 RepID=E8T5Q2_THEA1|nr:hypothetical protein [Thermovibrio ammonificans]ADU96527.1 hypothetical protein Theam_0555 [Thermovibrio ammonificans HB-1]
MKQLLEALLLLFLLFYYSVKLRSFCREAPYGVALSFLSFFFWPFKAAVAVFVSLTVTVFLLSAFSACRKSTFLLLYSVLLFLVGQLLVRLKLP